MNGWLLDTNVISELTKSRPDERVDRWARGQPEHTLFLSILTLAEFNKGLHHLTHDDPHRQRIRQIVLGIEDRFAGRILPLSNQTILRWGAISGELKRLNGHSPSVIDTLLASTAIEHHLYFATRNVADVEQSGAAVFNPWKDDPRQFSLAVHPQRR